MIGSLLLALFLNALSVFQPQQRCVAGVAEVQIIEHEGHWDVAFRDGRPGWAEFDSRDAASTAIVANRCGPQVQIIDAHAATLERGQYVVTGPHDIPTD